MLDTMKPIRTAVYTALNGNITYDSTAVPVSDEKTGYGNTANLFIVLTTQQETDESTSEAFITKSTIEIDIVHKTGSEVSKDAIDDVYQSMMQILIPSTSTIGLTVPGTFQFQNATRENSITMPMMLSETETVMVRRTRLSFTITQK